MLGIGRAGWQHGSGIVTSVTQTKSKHTNDDPDGELGLMDMPLLEETNNTAKSILKVATIADRTLGNGPLGLNVLRLEPIIIVN